MNTALALLFAAAAFAQPRDLRIAAVDFYGCSGLDPTRLRAELPFHEGDKINPESPPALAELSGRKAKLNFVYAPDFGLIVYVGLLPPGSAPIVYNPAPAGKAAMPARIVRAYKHSMDRFGSGGLEAGEDSSRGYFLSKDPVMRKDELGMMAYARKHSKVVYRVLESSGDTDQRIAAAWAAGYAPQDDAQIAALVRAVLDPDSTVRNNAIRCLGVLLEHSPEKARRVPPEPFIRLLHSLDWTDTNKSLMVLDSLTAGRDPNLLTALRLQALGPLREMAQWHYWGHASMALTVLGRVAGIEESRLQQSLNAKDRAAILRKWVGHAPPGQAWPRPTRPKR